MIVAKVTITNQQYCMCGTICDRVLIMWLILSTYLYRFDYVEQVHSASSLSTPPISDEPFANTLGDTVIKVTEVAPVIHKYN